IRPRLSYQNEPGRPRTNVRHPILKSSIERAQLSVLPMLSTFLLAFHLLRPRRLEYLFGIVAILVATCVAATAAEFTPAKYDLSALAPYKPEQMALGVVRIYGTPLESLVGRWAYAFRAKQGHVRLKAYLINTS